jgi:hypothetical protein
MSANGNANGPNPRTLRPQIPVRTLPFITFILPERDPLPVRELVHCLLLCHDPSASTLSSPPLNSPSSAIVQLPIDKRYPFRETGQHLHASESRILSTFGPFARNTPLVTSPLCQVSVTFTTSLVLDLARSECQYNPQVTAKSDKSTAGKPTLQTSGRILSLIIHSCLTQPASFFVYFEASSSSLTNVFDSSILRPQASQQKETDPTIDRPTQRHAVKKQVFLTFSTRRETEIPRISPSFPHPLGIIP